MNNWAFTFHIENGAWKERKNASFLEKDISEIPIVPIVEFYLERTGEKWEKAWCEKHHAYEEIQSCKNDQVITKNGCNLEGLVVPVKNYVYQSENRFFNEPSSITVCWQVHNRPADKMVYLEYDTIDILFNWEKEKTNEFIAVPSLVGNHKYTVSLSIAEGTTDNPYIKLPYAVMVCALKALQDNASSIYGFTPRVFINSKPEDEYSSRSYQSGYDLELKAFLKRPLDMSIFYFRKFFPPHKEGDTRAERNDFDILFPRDQRENFLSLAKHLHFEPTQEHRQLYESNPLALILHIVLPELGIETSDLISKFDHLESFCGKRIGEDTYRNRMFFDPLHQKENDEDDDETNAYKSLRFYCQWLRQHISEEKLAERLLVAQKNWRGWKLVALEYFRKYYSQVPQAWKDELIANGLSADLRDKLSILEQKEHELGKNVQYYPEAPDWECKINGYNFRLIPSIDKFKRMAWNLSSSHVTQRMDEVKEKSISCFAVERNGRYLGFIWLQDKTVMLDWFPEYKNYILMAKCHIAFLYWMKRNGLERNLCLNDDDSYVALNQPFNVEPVQKDQEWEKLSILEMMSKTPRAGYYLSYYRKLVEGRLLRTYSPALTEDEGEYIAKHYTWGIPIYEAAVRGNAEAQYVMSLFYRDGVCTAYPDRRRGEEWYKRAVESGWLEIAPDQGDIQIAGFPLPKMKN
ncbi:hypothetical protein [Selenomonas sp. AE3005]|uniref:hypothetical protein n=1 Tax=Selenomonas sp. AE3005 TaxID=1485543 RepID=UPI000484D4E0|nr:hypothetical protein [Selenomonas sp. AE3005]